MKEFMITTETNSDLPAEYLRDNNIGIIPHYYEMDGVVYGEDKEMTVRDFYDEMRKGKMPITMASNPAVIRETFQKYVSEGYDILHISFSSALSGGFSNVSVGAKEICEENPGAKIIVFDTLNVSLAEGLMIIEAVKMRSEGKTIDEAAAWLEEHKQEYCVQFTVDSLFHLQRGGRVTKASAIVGTMINVKPILHINEEGALVPFGTVRGRKKSLSTIVDNMIMKMGKSMAEKPLIGIAHGDAYNDAIAVQALIKDKIPNAETIINNIGPSIGAHSGPGAIGLMFRGEHK